VCAIESSPGTGGSCLSTLVRIDGDGGRVLERLGDDDDRSDIDLEGRIDLSIPGFSAAVMFTDAWEACDG